MGLNDRNKRGNVNVASSFRDMRDLFVYSITFKVCEADRKKLIVSYLVFDNHVLQGEIQFAFPTFEAYINAIEMKYTPRKADKKQEKPITEEGNKLHEA